jgi:hypothetical protein
MSEGNKIISSFREKKESSSREMKIMNIEIKKIDIHCLENTLESE